MNRHILESEMAHPGYVLDSHVTPLPRLPRPGSTEPLFPALQPRNSHRKTWRDRARWWVGLPPAGIQKEVPVSPLVTVIIPAHNEQECLARTIRSVLKQPHLHKVIIVNDGSSDGTGDIADKFARMVPDKVMVVHRKVASGHKAGAINVVLLDPSIVKGPFIAIIDADTVLHEEAFERMLQHFYNPRIAGVSARVVAGPPPNGKRSWGYLGKVGENLASHLLAKPAQAHEESILVSAGCASIFRTEVADRFEEVAAEDMEFSMRVSKTHDLSYEPTAICYSAEPPTMRVFVKQRMRWIMGSLQCYQLHILHGDMRRKNFKVWAMAHYMFMSGLMGLPLILLLLAYGGHTVLPWLLRFFGIELDAATRLAMATLSPFVFNLAILAATIVTGAAFARKQGVDIAPGEAVRSIVPTFICSFVIQGVFWYSLWKVFFAKEQHATWDKGH